MIYLGADHRGFHLKEDLKQNLQQAGRQVIDLGDDHYDPDDDYVDFAAQVAEAVVKNPGSCGIVICGSGAGVDMVANKVPGIRSALVFDEARSKQAREHEDANVLALPADVLTTEMADKITRLFLDTPFSGEARHIRRLEKMQQLEKNNV